METSAEAIKALIRVPGQQYTDVERIMQNIEVKYIFSLTSLVNDIDGLSD